MKQFSRRSSLLLLAICLVPNMASANELVVLTLSGIQSMLDAQRMAAPTCRAWTHEHGVKYAGSSLDHITNSTEIVVGSYYSGSSDSTKATINCLYVGDPYAKARAEERRREKLATDQYAERIKLNRPLYDDCKNKLDIARAKALEAKKEFDDSCKHWGVQQNLNCIGIYSGILLDRTLSSGTGLNVDWLYSHDIKELDRVYSDAIRGWNPDYFVCQKDSLENYKYIENYYRDSIVKEKTNGSAVAASTKNPKLSNSDGRPNPSTAHTIGSAK